MATAFVSARRFTQAEFYDWIKHESGYLPGHYELVDGHIVVTPPARPRHGSLQAELTSLLHQHVKTRRLGKVLNSGYDLPSGDTLEPDVSFIAADKVTRTIFDDDEKGFCRIVPDLAVEILSRSTVHLDRNRKKAIYARNGLREYWIVDHRRRSITVFLLGATGYDESSVVTAGRIPSRVLPDLVATVEEIFSSLD
ncbi:MAG TPA: Uma2 family endonuclease [Candidatus Binatia bacterium]|nr:Uma2 family endonuclease [Candidatus Binatia bacterium]